MAARKDMSYYEDFKNRLETFANWSKLLKHKPKELAEAGFVYTGVGDQTLCFSCGGVVKNWEEIDNSWVQHALSFPHCNFLSTSKDLRVESNRLDTFKDWKNTSVIPKVLANAGFYYLGISDQVKCAFCTLKLGHWKSDDPMDVHVKYSPKCPLVKEQQKKLSTLVSNGLTERDVCRNHALPEADAISLFKQTQSHEDINSRLKTFDNCSRSLHAKIGALVEAGFYYKGVGDQVACFHCGGGLAQWTDDDDPWEQHALWFPQCNFLRRTKGLEFIDAVRSKAQLKNAESVKEKSSEHDSVAKCKICFSNDVEVVLVPCGHLLACMTCSLLLNNACPACRRPFQTTLRIYPV